MSPPPGFDHEAFFHTLENTIKEHIPGFSVRYKDESTSQKILGILLKPFVPKYMTGFTTTLGKTVYYTSRSRITETPNSAWETLAHEFVHLYDGKQRPLHFSLTYLMPQILGLVAFAALAAIWTTPWALLALVFLLFAAPWPSRGRTRAELRGFGMDLSISYWSSGEIPGWKRSFFMDVFTGWSYYKMCPSKDKMERNYHTILSTLETHNVPFTDGDLPYRVVYDLLHEHKYFSESGF